jgi:hypothetical protein
MKNAVFPIQKVQILKCPKINSAAIICDPSLPPINIRKNIWEKNINRSILRKDENGILCFYNSQKIKYLPFFLYRYFYSCRPDRRRYGFSSERLDYPRHADGCRSFYCSCGRLEHPQSGTAHLEIAGTVRFPSLRRVCI